MSVLSIGSADAAGVERVPLNAQGEPVGTHSANPELSYDGRYLVFQSSEDGLTPDDDNGVSDIYLYDHESRDLVRASGGFLGTFGDGHSVHPAISSSGRFVAFASDASALNLPIGFGQTEDVIDANDSRDIFVFDRDLNQLTAVSVGVDGRLLDDTSDYPSISGDGRFVAFQSRGSTAQAPGGVWRVFVHDRTTGESRVISVDEIGRAPRLDSERPVISADGSYVAFESDAALVGHDTNGRRDVYRYGLEDGSIELVSVSSQGDVSVASSRNPSISANGMMIAFESAAPDLAPNDTNLAPDVFVRDLSARTTRCVSVSSDGEQADGPSRNAVISADGSVVVFESFASSLTATTRTRNPQAGAQGIERSRVFLHSIPGGRTVLAVEDIDRVAAASPTRDGEPSISGDGSTMVFNELPIFEQPGGPQGEIAHGSIYRVGSCLLSPDFAVTSILLDGVPQPIGGMGDNVLVAMRPLSVAPNLEVVLSANDVASCDEEVMRIRLLAPQGTDVLPSAMMYIQDSIACNGGGASPLVVGTLATADDAMDDDLGISLCWQPNVDDFTINGGAYQLEFIADFPGALQPSRVTVTIQILECDIEVDLFPDFDPGFTSGVGGESQFDLDGDGDNDFLDRDIQDVMGPSNRWDQDFLADLDTMTLVPSEIAEFSFTFSVLDPPQNPDPMPSDLVCSENNIGLLDILDPPAAPYQRGPGECGPMEGMPPMPCFITIDQIFGESSSGSLIELTAPPVYPLTLGQFEAEAGWPAGDTLVSVTFEMTAAPTIDDIGNNLVSYRITDATGHISDPQVNFVVVGCFDPPCCVIDQYQIEGVDQVVRDIPTETITVPGPDGPIELMCAGEPLVQPAGDGIIDVFVNQTLSFVVNGNIETECPGARLTINKDESGGDIFPAGVVCVDLDDAGLEYVCLGEPGEVDSGVKAFIEWTPTTADIRDDVYLLRFTVTDGAGRTTDCLVRVRVCPEPVCSGTVTIDDGEPIDLDFSNPKLPPVQTVVPGEVVTLHICGEQDCGEFVSGLPPVQAIYRTISIAPTDATCQLLCDLGWTSPDLDCTGMMAVCTPTLGIDSPSIDSDNADGDNDDLTGAEDPFTACQTFMYTVPDDFDVQTTVELCFEITDASGKPQECCVTFFVCPPVECDYEALTVAGMPVMDEPLMVYPGEEFGFTIRGMGGCDESSLQILSLDLFTDPLIGDEMLVDDALLYCMAVAPDTIPSAIGAPGMDITVDVLCTLPASLYEMGKEFIFRATIISGADTDFQQISTCDLRVILEPCPEPPACVIAEFSPEICTLDGTEASYDFPSMGMEGMPLIPTYEIHVEPGSATIGSAMFTFSAMTDCFGATYEWSVKGYPIDSQDMDGNDDQMNPAIFTVEPGAGLTMPVSTEFMWTPDNPDKGPNDDLGDHFVTFTVTDNTGQQSMCQVRIIVCDPPSCVITLDQGTSGFQWGDDGVLEVSPGDMIMWMFTTTDACDVDAQLMVDVTGVPVGATHEDIELPVGFTPAPVASKFSWTPGDADVGTYTIEYTTKDRCGRMSTCSQVIRVCEPPVCEMTVMVNGSPVVYDPNNPLSCIEIYPGEDLALALCGAPGSAECDDLPLTLTQLSAPVGGPALMFNPALPLMGMVGMDGRLCADGTLIPGPLDVSDTKYVWSFMIEDQCGRVSEDLCELRVRVLPCVPVCEVQDIMLNGSPYDPDNLNDPIIPGETLTYTIKGTVGCVADGLGLELDCDVPEGAVVTPNPLVIMEDDKVTMRTWDVEWTPLAGDYCAEEGEPITVSFDCSVRVTPEVAAGGAEPGSCDLDVRVGECPPPLCEISAVAILRDNILMNVDPGDGIVVVQPGDMVEFVVTGKTECPVGAENSLTIFQKEAPDVTYPFPPGAMMNPILPTTGGPDMSVTSTFMWEPTLEECGFDFEARFNIGQTCGPLSEDDCAVIFRVGFCDVPPTCELDGFMIRPNPETCPDPHPSEDGEIPFQDLPFDEVDDGYMVFAFPGDTIKLQFCGSTECTCTSLTLDADGLPEDAVITCYDAKTDSFLPSMFPHTGGQNETPLCCMVEFVVPPTGSFHITFIVSDSDDKTPDAECVLWVEVEEICNDFEPNDDCELPQIITVTSLDPEDDPCGPYLSGTLEQRKTPGCQPDTFLVLFNKQNEIINFNNNGSDLGNSKADALYDITAANGLSEGNGSDRWLRIGVTGYPDGLVKPFNGYPQNGPHGQLGEFELTVTFFDGAGEIISPAIVQDANGNDVMIDNPYVYTNEFITGAEAFRLNFQAPRALQGGGVTASASVEIDNTTGLDPLCDDVDFFKYVGLVPFTDYCITTVGGLSKDCTPIDLQLGWFDKSCDLLLLDCDSGPSGYAMLCVVADTNGEVIIGVTGKGDDDFDGYLVPPPAPLVDDRAVNGCPDPSTDHGVCGCYTLCIMAIHPHTGELVDRSPSDLLAEAYTEAMHHGDMNMDGKTDTADLGLLMGRFGWSATDGVDTAGPVKGGDDRAKAHPGVIKTTPLSGAMEE